MAGFDAPQRPFAVPLSINGGSRGPQSAVGDGLGGPAQAAVKPSEIVRQFFAFLQNFRIGEQGWLYRCVARPWAWR